MSEPDEKPTGVKISHLLIILVVIGGMLFYILKSSRDAMYPTPKATHFEYFQSLLKSDNLPVKADILIACELDRPSYVGEGTLLMTWNEFSKKLNLEPLPGSQETFLIENEAGTFTVVKKIDTDRVRIHAGALRSRKDALKVFAQEMDSGQGKHPPYRTR